MVDERGGSIMAVSPPVASHNVVKSFGTPKAYTPFGPAYEGALPATAKSDVMDAPLSADIVHTIFALWPGRVGQVLVIHKKTAPAHRQSFFRGRRLRAPEQAPVLQIDRIDVGIPRRHRQHLPSMMGASGNPTKPRSP